MGKVIGNRPGDRPKSVDVAAAPIKNAPSEVDTGAAQPAISICTAADFDLIRKNLSGNFKLVCDVDLSSVTPWVPIGPFTGTFDGGGIYRITGLSGDNGLFSKNAGTIRNVGIVNAKIRRLPSSPTFLSNIGILVGWNTDQGTIDSCDVGGTIELSNASSVGAVAGYNQGKINECISRGSIKDVGTAQDSNGNAVGTLYWVGGMVGQGSADSLMTICYAFNSINGGADYIGGLAGTAGTIKDSASTGNVIGGPLSSWVGGLVGGTLAGGTLVVENSYHQTGAVSGTAGVGGLVGLTYEGSLRGSHVFDVTITATEMSAGQVVGLRMGGMPVSDGAATKTLVITP